MDEDDELMSEAEMYVVLSSLYSTTFSPDDRYFDRQGQQISQLQYVILHDSPYAQVARTRLRNETWVSTIWLGYDAGYGHKDDPPIIFETMINRRGEGWSDQYRYRTEEEAVTFHNALVRLMPFKTRWARRRYLFVGTIIGGTVGLVVYLFGCRITQLPFDYSFVPAIYGLGFIGSCTKYLVTKWGWRVVEHEVSSSPSVDWPGGLATE